MTDRTLKAQRGFSLMELSIVLAIVSLLAAVAIPTFLGFKAKAKRAERTPMAKVIAQMVADYYEQYGRFPDGTVPNTSLTLDWNPPYAADGSKKPFDTTLGNWKVLGVKPEGDLYYRYFVHGETTATSSFFTVQVEGDADDNRQVNIFTQTYKPVDGNWELISETETGDAF